MLRFIAVPAKWIRTARQYKLNIYSNKPYKLIWEHGYKPYKLIWEHG